jgi:hypothetical protein
MLDLEAKLKKRKDLKVHLAALKTELTELEEEIKAEIEDLDLKELIPVERIIVPSRPEPTRLNTYELIWSSPYHHTIDCSNRGLRGICV